MRIGYEWVHSLVDDHSRYAYSELHRDEKATTVTGFVERGLAVLAEQGIELKRLMSDNAWTYTHNRALAQLLSRRGISHLRKLGACGSSPASEQRLWPSRSSSWARAALAAARRVAGRRSAQSF